MKTELGSQFRVTGYLLFPVLLVGAMLLASCATTPKPTAATTAPATQPAPAAQPTPKSQVPAPTAELQKAKSMKAEIDQYQLGPLVPDAYKLGNEDLTAGEQAIGTDNATAKNKLDAAVAAYQQVFDTGIPIGLKQEAAMVAKARDAADAVKADKAVPDLYQQAVQFQQQAEAKQKANSPAEAYSLYQQAASTFAKAEASAKQKRADAEAALKQAESQIGQAKSQIETTQKNLESSLSSESSANSGTGGGQ